MKDSFSVVGTFPCCLWKERYICLSSSPATAALCRVQFWFGALHNITLFTFFRTTLFFFSLLFGSIYDSDAGANDESGGYSSYRVVLKTLCVLSVFQSSEFSFSFLIRVILFFFVASLLFSLFLAKNQ